MRKVLVGEKYKHYRTKAVYEVVDTLPLKVDSEWEAAVIYRGPCGSTFVRPESNFKRKFTIIEQDGKPLNMWYKSTIGSIVFFTGDKTGFGATPLGDWFNNDRWGPLSDSKFELCPTSEWKEMLIRQAESRGYEEENYEPLQETGRIFEPTKKFYVVDGSVWTKPNGFGGHQIFDGFTGEWAKIIKVPIQGQIKKLQSELEKIQKELLDLLK